MQTTRIRHRTQVFQPAQKSPTQSMRSRLSIWQQQTIFCTPSKNSEGARRSNDNNSIATTFLRHCHDLHGAGDKLVVIFRVLWIRSDADTSDHGKILSVVHHYLCSNPFSDLLSNERRPRQRFFG